MQVSRHTWKSIYTPCLNLHNENTGDQMRWVGFFTLKNFTGRALYACYCFGCQSCDAAKCAIQTVTLFHLFSSHGVPCGAVHLRVDGNLSERPNRLLLDGSTVHGGLHAHRPYFLISLSSWFIFSLHVNFSSEPSTTNVRVCSPKRVLLKELHANTVQSVVSELTSTTVSCKIYL